MKAVQVEHGRVSDQDLPVFPEVRTHSKSEEQSWTGQQGQVHCTLSAKHAHIEDQRERSKSRGNDGVLSSSFLSLGDQSVEVGLQVLGRIGLGVKKADLGMQMSEFRSWPSPALRRKGSLLTSMSFFLFGVRVKNSIPEFLVIDMPLPMSWESSQSAKDPFRSEARLTPTAFAFIPVFPLASSSSSCHLRIALSTLDSFCPSAGFCSLALGG